METSRRLHAPLRPIARDHTGKAESPEARYRNDTPRPTTNRPQIHHKQVTKAGATVLQPIFRARERNGQEDTIGKIRGFLRLLGRCLPLSQACADAFKSELHAGFEFGPHEEHESAARTFAALRGLDHTMRSSIGEGDLSAGLSVPPSGHGKNTHNLPRLVQAAPWKQERVMSESQLLARVLSAAFLEILEEASTSVTDMEPIRLPHSLHSTSPVLFVKAARAVCVRNRSMRNDRESVVQLFFGHNRRLPFLYVVKIGLGKINGAGNLVRSCRTASEIWNELLNFALVRMFDVLWKRDEFSSAQFGGVRSVFPEEWAREVKADFVQGLTAR